MIDGSQVAQSAVNGILQRIDTLAAKIGTTATQLWQVYVQQGRVEGIRDLLMVVVWILIAGLAAFLASVITTGAVIAGVICVFVFAYSAVGELMNPQYWAFQHLAMDIKGLL